MKRELGGARIALVFGLASLAAVVRADVTVTLQESGGNVVATYAGSLNTTSSIGVYPLNPTSPFGSIWPLGPRFESVTGTAVILVSQFFTGPASFGSSGATVTGVVSGQSFGFGPVDQEPGKFGYIVPDGYQSGSALSGTATWNSTSFSGLGITPGSYAWTTGTDTITLTTISVPEPGVSLMALIGTATAAIRLSGCGVRSPRARRTAG